MIAGCFVGIPLPEACVAAFSEMQHELKALTAAKYQKAESSHVTILYFGVLREEKVTKIMTRLEELATTLQPFLIRSSGIGYFGTERHPRVAWIGVQPNDPLAALHTRIDAVVGAFAARREDRAFRPHLTVARITSARGFLDRKAAFEAIVAKYDFSFSADRLCLYTADTETHERQEPLETFSFRG